LLSVGDKPVSDTVSMLNLVAQLTPGDKVPLTVLRKSKKTELNVVVGKRPRMKQQPLQDSE
jgi:serine protease DegQ